MVSRSLAQVSCRRSRWAFTTRRVAEKRRDFFFFFFYRRLRYYAGSHNGSKLSDRLVRATGSDSKTCRGEERERNFFPTEARKKLGCRKSTDCGKIWAIYTFPYCIFRLRSKRASILVYLVSSLVNTNFSWRINILDINTVFFFLMHKMTHCCGNSD